MEGSPCLVSQKQGMYGGMGCVVFGGGGSLDRPVAYERQRRRRREAEEAEDEGEEEEAKDADEDTDGVGDACL